MRRFACMSGHMGTSGAKDQKRSALTRCGAKAHPEPGRLQFRRSAVTSTSNFISGLTNAHTRQVAAGLISPRSEEHTSELQSLMRISYAVFCLKKKTKKNKTIQ